MISCEHTQNLFEAYLNDELAPSLVMEVDAHCLDCPSCRQQLGLMEACGNVVCLDTSEPNVSNDFTGRLMAIMDEEQSRKRGLQLSRRMKIAGGLLGVAASIVLLCMLQFRQPERIGEVAGAGSKDTPDNSVPLAESVVDELLGIDAIGFMESVAAMEVLVELATDKADDAAAEDGRAPIEDMGPWHDHDGPSILDVTEEIDDSGELM